MFLFSFTNDWCLSFFVAGQCSIVCKQIPQFLYPFICWWIYSLLHSLTIVNCWRHNLPFFPLLSLPSFFFLCTTWDWIQGLPSKLHPSIFYFIYLVLFWHSVSLSLKIGLELGILLPQPPSVLGLQMYTTMSIWDIFCISWSDRNFPKHLPWVSKDMPSLLLICWSGVFLAIHLLSLVFWLSFPASCSPANPLCFSVVSSTLHIAICQQAALFILFLANRNTGLFRDQMHSRP